MRRKPASPTSETVDGKGRGIWMALSSALILLITSTTALAGPMPPAEKEVAGDPEGRAPVTAHWFLQNGAFDEPWDGDVPASWQVYPGDADAYGALNFLNPDATVQLNDNAFVFQIINNEIKGNQNAYLYQEMMLPRGDYWIELHSTIYGLGTGFFRSTDPGVPNAYSYMAYYALVPEADVMRAGAFTPSLVRDDDWKELWPWSSVCSEAVKGWGVTDRMSDCDYVKRAETVSVSASGEYVFILRAELKWPDWRAFAFYIFDDIQVIAARSQEEIWNECADSYCLEGLIDR